MALIKHRKKRSKTIFANLITTMLIVLIIQTIFFASAILIGGAIKNLNKSTIQLFDERVSYRANFIQTEFINRWMNLDSTYSAVTKTVDDIVISENKSYDDLLQSDVNLNVAILNEVSEDLLNSLNRNAVSGTFIVFGNIDNQNKYGLYFRNTNPLVAMADYSNFVIEVAPYNFVNKHKILSSSYSKTKFDFKNSSTEDQHFFTKPIQAKKDNASLSYNNCGWWSSPYYLNNEAIEVITYSMPLVNSNGLVYGVMGVDISISYLCDLMPYTEINNSSDSYYVLTKFNNNTYDINNAIISGINIERVENILSPSLEDYNNTVIKNVHTINLNKEKNVYVSFHSIKIYNSNGPFEAEQWYVIGTCNSDFIHQYANTLQQIIYFVIAISFIIAIIIVIISSYIITKPIAQLTQEIKNANPSNVLVLDKINVREIDDLTRAIEILSRNVFEAEIKLSKIVGLVNLPIVAFEYDYVSKIVYTSRDISTILQIDNKSRYTIEEFNALFISLEPYIIGQTDKECTYKYKNNFGHNHWIDVRYIDSKSKNISTGIIVNVTKEYMEKENLIRERNYDSLTNIYNRRAFQDQIEKLFETPEQLGYATFVMLDLDNLKFINDRYGHDWGDEYIRKAASAIESCCANSNHCLYGRRSGDEFYIFLYGYENYDDAEEEVLKIQRAFLNTYIGSASDFTVRVRISAGYSCYPKDADNPDDLMKYADFAMYEIKNSLKGEFKKFDSVTYEQNAYLLKNREDLNNLIENELVDFHLQPIVNLKDGTIFGYESLMRSLIPAFRSPKEIITLAKIQFQLGKIERLTIIKTLEKYEKYLNDFKGKKIFINSIASQCLSIEDGKYIEERYKNILPYIVVEFADYDKSMKVFLDQKRNLVYSWNSEVALDNYGTSYNGETLLLETKPNYVKIDMELVRDINTDKDRQQMVSNIIDFAKSKGIITIAEGVETQDELEFLISINCDYAQGYFLGYPQSLPEDITSEIKSLIINFNNKK